MQMKMGSESEWLRGRKYLINPELLGQINTASHQARNVIQRHALPFPITSIYLIPKDSLKLVDERLEQYKKRFWHTVDEFMPQYMPAREEARIELGELYNDDDLRVISIIDGLVFTVFEGNYLSLTFRK
jgi:hypothetical protein